MQKSGTGKPEPAELAIRFLNRGYHNIRFDRGMDLRVASPHQAILALVGILSSKVENRGRCTQVPTGAYFGGALIFEEGADGLQKNQHYSASGVIGAAELL